MKRVELLMPAGSPEAAIAAVENGADAVYLGGRAYGARAHAVNFGLPEIRSAVRYAHQRGVRIHVTMNTLMRDSELPEALEYAGKLYEAGVDALIIQDLGLARLIHRNMPDFPMHLSTQATAYDLRCVEEAEKMGFERAVLARELSLDEIRRITAASPIEIEVFIHGAVCICYSGQCQLSRRIGGRSANRGECAQPCRLPWRMLDRKGRLLHGPAAALSPKDLSFLDHLPDLISAGAASFKIEGRMKSPEYVGICASIFRKYIDLYYSGKPWSVDPADRAALEQIFSRGGFTDAYLSGSRDPNMMSGDIAKAAGVRIGKVIKRVGDSTLVDVKLYSDLAMHDGVEIHGRDGEGHEQVVTGNIVTYKKDLKGGLTRIGDLKRPRTGADVKHGDELYRTSSIAQLEEIRKTFEGLTFEEGKYGRRVPVDIAVESSNSELKATARLKIDTPRNSSEEDLAARCGSASVSVTGGPYPKPEDPSRAVRPDRIASAMKKTGNTPFEVKTVEIRGEIPVMIRASELNRLRRELLAALEDLLAGCRRSAIPVMDLDEAVPAPRQEPKPEFFYYDLKSFREDPVSAADLDPAPAAVLPLAELPADQEACADIRESAKARGFSGVIPYISNMTRGREEQELKVKIAAGALGNWKETGVYTGTLSWIRPLREAGVPVLGDYGLNVYNRSTVRALQALGVSEAALSLEEEGPESGSISLMTTQYDLDSAGAAYLIDPRKDRFQVFRPAVRDQVLILTERGADDPDRMEARIQQGIPEGSPSRILRFYRGPSAW